jgi:hypothetical protein
MTVSAIFVSATLGEVDERMLIDLAVAAGIAEGATAKRPDNPASSPSHHVGK